MSYILNIVKEQGIVKIIEEQSKSIFDDIIEKAKQIGKQKDMVVIKANEWEDCYDQSKKFTDKYQDNIEDWSLIAKQDDIIYLVLQLGKVKNQNKHILFVPFELMTNDDIINFPINEENILR